MGVFVAQRKIISMKMFDNLTNLNQGGVGIETPPSQCVECGYPKQQKPLDTTTLMHFLHFNLTCSKFQLHKIHSKA
jgi:Zn ribbon nucleic-acid-binding protein